MNTTYTFCKGLLLGVGDVCVSEPTESLFNSDTDGTKYVSAAFGFGLNEIKYCYDYQV